MSFSRTSPYFDLRFVVQVKAAPRPFFECIAAFNVPAVAQRYAADCRTTNPANEYRVMQRSVSSGRLTELKVVVTIEHANGVALRN